MIWLSNSTVARLRDQLQARGQRPSLVAPEANLTADAVEMLNIVAEYGPLCEAMYLMMSADGTVGTRSARSSRARSATSRATPSAARKSSRCSTTAGKRVAEEGRDARMKEVVASLHEDKARAEVAFVLAAAIAFADNAIADEENETLNELAEGLGIDEARANELLDDVEKDLGGAGASRRRSSVSSSRVRYASERGRADASVGARVDKTEGTGQRVGGYRVVRRLATGGTSDVLLAKAEGPHGFERSVVLKLLLLEYRSTTPSSRACSPGRPPRTRGSRIRPSSGSTTSSRTTTSSSWSSSTSTDLR